MEEHGFVAGLLAALRRIRFFLARRREIRDCFKVLHHTDAMLALPSGTLILVTGRIPVRMHVTCEAGHIEAGAGMRVFARQDETLLAHDNIGQLCRINRAELRHVQVLR